MARNPKDMVLILFRDHTWYACYPTQIEAFVGLKDGMKYIIIKEWDANKFFSLIASSFPA